MGAPWKEGECKKTGDQEWRLTSVSTAKAWGCKPWLRNALASSAELSKVGRMPARQGCWMGAAKKLAQNRRLVTGLMRTGVKVVGDEGHGTQGWQAGLEVDDSCCGGLGPPRGSANAGGW